MLHNLYIENVALIEKLDIEFGEGFNVLTGETGAGKSILIDAVSFVLGERASREIIKHGTQKAKVEAVFDVEKHSLLRKFLDENSIECEDNELILSRELNVAGKNVCRINGVLVNVAMLKIVSDCLVDIHGQHEHQSLLDSQQHINFLDAYAGKTAQTIKETLILLCEKWADTKRELNSGFASARERERRVDILSYQLQEIENASISWQEEQNLLAERLLQANAERIVTMLSTALDALNGEAGALNGVGVAHKALNSIESFSEGFSITSNIVGEAYYNLEDAAHSLRDSIASIEYDQRRLDEIERRLDVYSGLKRKYGHEVSDVLSFAKTARDELENLLNSEKRAAELTAVLDAIMQQYTAAANELTAIRSQAAQRLSSEIKLQLSELGMTKTEFSVEFTKFELNEPNPGGFEAAEFMLSANPGEPQKPLAKVASGGELARIMLGFKAIFADSDNISTLIFDEIDTGISGKIATTVGEKMLAIAKNHQVVCVTHLPQIAAMGTVHFLVEKITDGNSTHVSIKSLTIDGKYERIAQMMDGTTGSDLALIHAKTLVDAAHKL